MCEPFDESLLEQALRGKNFFKQVSTLRHDFTRYDVLATYYNCQLGFREELNRTCMEFIRCNIDFETFRAIVKSIEARVDLGRAKNRKEFLKNQARELHESGYSKVEAKKVAEDRLSDLLHRNHRYNEEIKARGGVFSQH